MLGKKHKGRYRLRSLLLIVAMSGALAGQFGKYWKHKKAEVLAEQTIRRAGGVLVYSSRFDPKIEFRDCNQLRRGVFRIVPLVRSVVEVRMAGCDVTEDLLKNISQLRHVRRISLGQSNTNGNGLFHLAGLHSLEQLDLQSTDISDASLDQVAQIRNLTYLNLGLTQVSDEGLAHLHSMKKLKQVGLAGTQVTQTGIDRISRAIPKLRVYLGSNRQF